MQFVSKAVTAHSLLWFTPMQCIERKDATAADVR
jgi:hypothetical protein